MQNHICQCFIRSGIYCYLVIYSPLIVVITGTQYIRALEHLQERKMEVGRRAHYPETTDYAITKGVEMSSEAQPNVAISL